MLQLHYMQPMSDMSPLKGKVRKPTNDSKAQGAADAALQEVSAGSGRHGPLRKARASSQKDQTHGEECFALSNPGQRESPSISGKGLQDLSQCLYFKKDGHFLRSNLDQ